MKALLVEDDSSVALVVQMVLQKEGWSVEEAPDATRALTAKTPDLLVTDLNLPGGQDGTAVARQLRQRNPQLAVVLISGDFEESGPGPNAMVTLSKPFRRKALLDAIAQARSIVSGGGGT
ncbi:response regulator [Gluconobacter morbifer]|uniref:Response regulatory domain-containing protein n=1 Tax=Gluconobacter morbifer G707 TaxID=1088869 RepID=G6XJX9_9PROT|nr:response regulator [Gluconobacter morbifer]EHH67941.1 hypothetical protein GMO_17080 [Gluconobacter morbifer G707]